MSGQDLEPLVGMPGFAADKWHSNPLVVTVPEGEAHPIDNVDRQIAAAMDADEWFIPEVIRMTPIEWMRLRCDPRAMLYLSISNGKPMYQKLVVDVVRP